MRIDKKRVIKNSNYNNQINVDHKKFKAFAYYKVGFKIKNDIYAAILNIGIRENGSLTLYDINPFEKH